MADQAMIGSTGVTNVPGAQRDFHRHLTRAVIWPVTAMVTLSAVFLALIALLLNSSRWVEHSIQVIAQLHQIEKLLVDRETGLRGYLLTDNPAFLEPYNAAESALPPSIEHLGALVADNPAQLQHIATLTDQRRSWEQFAQRVLERYQQGGDYQADIRAGIGKRSMDRMRLLLAEMMATEEQLRQSRVEATRWTTVVVAGVSLLLALVVSGLLAWGTRQQLLALAQQYGTALEATARAATRLQTLHTIDRAILTQTPLADTVQTALRGVGPLVGAQRSVAVLAQQDQLDWQRLVVDAGGTRAEILPRGTDGFDRFADFGSAPRPSLADTATISGVPSIAGPLAEAKLPQALIAPLSINGATGGVLALGLPEGATPHTESTVLIREIADQLTIALQQERLRHDVARHTAELERRVAERTAALEAANAELEAFGYSVAHDLRAPIRAMQGFAVALQEDYGEQIDAQGQEYLQRILDAGQNMEQLISDLLTYSRLSRAELLFGDVPLRQALDDALGQLGEEITARGADIRVVGPLPVVRGHRPTLAQVLTNLLANAMKFVAPGDTPQIELRSSATDGRARLVLRDNGIGIAPEHQERIFRVFERLHGAEHYPGTGIGLAIVRKGVERMGGQAGVESAPGAGSTFWIELPTTESAE
ncbi:MAG TPA: CHASE3 domain-containing protein [Roseiflexaceae bacterium]|nr:CHASE3 domain-containing protein [Roseiflexaceae bacterium]